MKLRMLFSLFIILLSIPFYSIEVEAANGTTYEVGVNILHVREEPAGSANIIGILHKGDKLTGFQEKYGWVQTYYAGETAWVAKHYLVPEQSVKTTSSNGYSVTPSNESITITASSVNIRSGPSLEYRVVAGTSIGNSYQALDYSGDWIKIALEDGTTGWVAAWLTNANSSNPSNSTHEQVAATSTSSSLSGFTIVLDAGHGGRDPGAIGLGGILEKDLIQSTSGKVADTLRTFGATVIETRTSDYYVSLDDRAHLSNAYGADAFISLHYNSFPVLSVQGIQTFYYSEYGSRLANNVHTSIVSAVPLTNRGTAQADFKVLRNTNAPAILLELGFITNPYDLSIIRTADYQHRVADAIAKGLLQFFN